MHYLSKKINIFFSIFRQGFAGYRLRPFLQPAISEQSAIFPAHCEVWRMKKHVILSGFMLLFFQSAPVWAVQRHGQAEGPVVHMMAHLLLGVALLLFLYVLHTKPPDARCSWRSLKLSLLFFLLWNLDLLFVHWFADQISADIRASGVSLVGDYFIGPRTLLNLAYYLGRFDHLLCVPAFWFFTTALRDCREAIETRRQGRNEQAV